MGVGTTTVGMSARMAREVISIQNGGGMLTSSIRRAHHRDYKRIEGASGDESRDKLNKSNGGQI